MRPTGCTHIALQRPELRSRQWCLADARVSAGGTAGCPRLAPDCLSQLSKSRGCDASVAGPGQRKGEANNCCMDGTSGRLAAGLRLGDQVQQLVPAQLRPCVLRPGRRDTLVRFSQAADAHAAQHSPGASGTRYPLLPFADDAPVQVGAPAGASYAESPCTSRLKAAPAPAAVRVPPAQTPPNCKLVHDLPPGGTSHPPACCKASRLLRSRPHARTHCPWLQAAPRSTGASWPAGRGRAARGRRPVRRRPGGGGGRVRGRRAAAAGRRLGAPDALLVSAELVQRSAAAPGRPERGRGPCRARSPRARAPARKPRSPARHPAGPRPARRADRPRLAAAAAGVAWRTRPLPARAEHRGSRCGSVSSKVRCSKRILAKRLNGEGCPAKHRL